MIPSLIQIFLAVLFLSCMISFGWAMRNFFTKPDRMTAGMKLTTGLGALFGILHLIVLLMSSNVIFVTAAAAAIVYLFSLALFWWTIAANRAKPLSACFSKTEQLHLVQHGPYRFVRHPFYCSYLLAWLGGAIATQSLLLGATVIVMLTLYLSAANTEEKRFAQTAHGDAYRAYCKRTGQFFPLPWKMAGAGRQNPNTADSELTSGATEPRRRPL